MRGMENRACQKRACQIQRCLIENQYDMGACSFEIDALKRCCEQDFAKGSLHCAFYSRNADSKDTVSSSSNNNSNDDDPVEKANHSLAHSNPADVDGGEATDADGRKTGADVLVERTK